MSAEAATQDTDAPREQKDKKILDSLIAIIGFGLCRAWIVFCLSAPLVHAPFSPFNWMFLAAGAIMALGIALTVKHFNVALLRLRRYLFIATGVSLILTATLITISFFRESAPTLLAGFIIGGLGAGLLQVLWGEAFAQHTIRFVTVVSPAAAIVTALFVAVSSPQTTFIGYALFPLVSFALLLVLAERTGLKIETLINEKEPGEDSVGVPSAKGDITPSTEEERGDRTKPFGFEIGKLMFSIMVFSFLCRLFDAIPIEESDPFAFFGGSALFSLVIVGIVFLGFIAILKNRFNPTLTYRLSLPIMVAGFVAIALFFDTHAAFSVLLINIGYEFFDILAWILFTEVSKRKGENPLRIFGLGVAFMFIGMSVGTISGTILANLIVDGSLQINVIAMLSILSLVIVAFLVIPEGTIEHLAHTVRSDKKKDVPTSQGVVAQESRLEANCSEVAGEYRLTPRESEVLVLLAHGRTLSIIARDLQIAKGTARTHIENIYRKLDVHKQQELIDLVEGYEPQ